MKALATLWAVGATWGVAASPVRAEPTRLCEPVPHVMDAVADLMEREWWLLSPRQLDAIWPHPLRDTGCDAEEGRCLDRTWCGRSADRVDECTCFDQFSFGGPKGRLKLAFFGVTLEVDADQAGETALALADALEVTGRAVRVECAGVQSGAVACHEWPGAAPDGKVVTTSIWVHSLDRRSEVSVEASVLARP
jgi:hypothetical protein